MEWFRWYTGCATDPKFQVVAKRSGQTVAAVLAVWSMLLERACAAPERGEVAGFDCEGADVLLGLEDGAAEKIYETMKSRKLIEQGRISKWEERQPKREREDNSTDRVRQHRERQKATSNTTCDDVTPCNATQRQETPRLEEKRVEKNFNTLPPTPRRDANPEDPALPVLSDFATGRESMSPAERQERSMAWPPETNFRDDATFERFWEAYPWQVGKRSANAAWRRIESECRNVDPERIIAAIKAQVAGRHFDNLDGTPAYPSPTKWLEAGRWDDVVKPPGQASDPTAGMTLAQKLEWARTQK